MSETTDSRANDPVYRSFTKMTKARLVDYCLDRRRERATLEARLYTQELALGDIKDEVTAAIALSREIDPEWVLEQIETAQDDEAGQ